MGEAQKMAEAGMALFAKEGADDVEVDTSAAAAFKAEQEKAIEEKTELEKTLTGKDNKKQRTAVAKEIKDMKNDPKYIDACKIAKGMDPPKGNFIVKKSAPAAAAPAAEAAAPAAEPAAPAAESAKKAKDDKKPKKTESAGISKAERDELESLKQQIIKKKAELKEQGLSGGQCNKDPEVVTMVARMQELKIKEDPTLAEGGDGKKEKKKDKKLSAESEAEKKKLEEEIEEYRMKLQTEFKYTKKEINADPDMQDMLAKMKAFK